AARDVESRKVERQAEQVVAQRAGDKLVDLVADLIGGAERNLARRVRTLLQIGERVGERIDQTDVVQDRMTVRIEDRGTRQRIGRNAVWEKFRLDLEAVDV